MTSEKIIQIKGGTYKEVKGALKQWIASYANQLSDDSQFKLYKNSNGSHIIKADPRINNELFFFLVNYIGYPEGIDHKLKIEGFTKGEKNSQLAGQELLVYNSETDKEYDNVFAVTKENKHYKFDFGGKTESIQDSKLFSPLIIDKIGKPEILKVVRYRMADADPEVLYSDTSKRFNIVVIVSLLAHLINYVVFYFTNNTKHFEFGILMICLLITAWFYLDDELFHFDSLYYKAFLLALGLALYGCLITNYTDYRIKELLILFCCPLLLLLLQWPTRRLFKNILKREPKIVDYGTRNFKFADVIYTLILFLGMFGIPVYIMLYFY